MKTLVFNLPLPSPLGTSLVSLSGGEEGQFLLKAFPDKESYLRVLSPLKNSKVIINASLFHPNEVILNLLFLTDALRVQGVKEISLLVPYLPYMRQDKVFQKGEAVTSRTFAKLLSSYFNSLITIDPHLHRYANLSEIYSIPTTVLHAAPLLSKWIQTNVKDPFIIGPDEESFQWVKEIAGNLPFAILKKKRNTRGEVHITWPRNTDLKDKTPVIVDDIISSGQTMIHVLNDLKKKKTKPPLCLAIHPIFAGEAYRNIKAAGAGEIITCNSIPHPTNQIDLAPLVAGFLKDT